MGQKKSGKPRRPKSHRSMPTVWEAELKISFCNAEDFNTARRWMRKRHDLFPAMEISDAARMDAQEAGIEYQVPMNGKHIGEDRYIFATTGMILNDDPLAEIRATRKGKGAWPWEIVEKAINGADDNGVLIRPEITVMQHGRAPILKAIKKTGRKENLQQEWAKKAKQQDLRLIGRVHKQRSNMEVAEKGERYKYSWDQGTVKMISGADALGFYELEIELENFDPKRLSHEEASQLLTMQARKFQNCPVPLVWKRRFDPPNEGVARIGRESKLAGGIASLRESFSRLNQIEASEIMAQAAVDEFVDLGHKLEAARGGPGCALNAA